MKIGNSILSESLAYPIFLIFIIFFIKSIFGKKNYFKNFLLSLIFFSLLVLTKKTFLILVPVYFLSLIVELIFSKELKKAIGRLISAELRELRDWCFTQFSPQFDLVLKDCFQGIRLPERGRE
jgi:uncharacterized membrane protein